MKAYNLKPLPKSKIIGKECRHITYSVTPDKSHDALIVKEWLYCENGEVHPNLRLIEDMERKFWITKPGRRDHAEKQQWEDINNCNEYSCRQLELYKRIDKALGGYGNVKNPQMLLKSPYIYGCGIKPQCLVKFEYNNRYPDFISKSAKVAACDTETNVLDDSGDIIMCTLSFKDKVLFVADRKFYDGDTDAEIERKIREKALELIPEYLEERNITILIRLVDNAGEITKVILDHAHEWQPDFVEFWNMPFDINKMVSGLNKYGYDPKEVFSDPAVPEDYRFFKFKEGSPVKVIHTGEARSINPEARWHIVECPAGFFLVDGMTSYYRLRMGAGNEDSYALDAILEQNLNIKKLKIEEISHLTGIDWHKEMQRNYKYEYSVYNMFDCIALELLDEETSDICVKFPAQSTNSDYTDFKSGPTKIADDLHFHCLKYGKVVGVTDGDIRNDNDHANLVSHDWIITLDASLSQGIGVDFVTGVGVR